MTRKPKPFLPQWITDSIADDLEKRADRIERIFGPDAAAEARDILADLRAISDSGGQP